MLNQVKKDLQGLAIAKQITQAHIDEIKAAVEDSKAADALIAKIISSAIGQFAQLQIAINLAEEAGLPRGGHPAIMDSIMDGQFHKIKQYGNKAYPLSEKQIEVIIRNIWPYLSK